MEWQQNCVRKVIISEIISLLEEWVNEPIKYFFKRYTNQ